jgi:hypothetical protein
VVFVPADWINSELRRQDRAKWDREMRASSQSAGGCVIVPLALLPFLVGGFVVLVLVVRFAFGHSDFQEQMDAGHLAIVEPATLLGRDRNSDSTFDRGNAQRKADLTKILGSASTISAAYGASNDDAIILAASQGVFMKSADRIDGMLDIPVGGEVTDVRSVDPGPFGGVAKCGTRTTHHVAVGICAWIDGGTAGAIAVYRSDAEQAGKLLAKARGEVERRI